MAARIKAKIVGDEIQITGDQWGETIHAEALASRIGFYEKLRDRQSGRYSHIYGPTVEELKKVRKDAVSAGLLEKAN